MTLTDEEKAIIERHRASQAAKAAEWKPLAVDAMDPHLIRERYANVHSLALGHFNGMQDDRPCGDDCDCKQWIFEAAMEFLALPNDVRKMWDAHNRRHR